MADEDTADEATEQPQQAAEDSEQRAVLAQVIAKEELPRIRQRGVDDLDLTAHNRKPVSCERVEQLARVHSEKKGTSANSKPVLVRSLIDDALSAYAEQNEASATFIRELFFNSEDTTVPANPGKLLDDARKKSGLADNPQKFDRIRRKEFAKFSEFLADYVLRDAAVSPKTARIIYKVPKGYRFEQVKRGTWQVVRTSLRHRVRVPIAIVAIIMLGIVAVLVYFIYRLPEDTKIKVGRKTANTYAEPSLSALKGSPMKPGQWADPLCVATVLRADYTPVYWVQIETRPWENYYVLATDLSMGVKEGEALLLAGIPRCPTK